MSGGNAKPSRTEIWLLRIAGSLLALVGIVLALGGLRLITLGGSWYYLLAGVGMVAAGYFYARARILGALIFGLVFVATLLWAVWEAGFNFWPLVPRLGAPLAMALVASLLLPALRGGKGRRASFGLAGVIAILIAVSVWQMFVPHGVIKGPEHPEIHAQVEQPAQTIWPIYGGTAAGTRFSPVTQITPGNVDKLEVAWTYHTGDIAGAAAEDQQTPLQVGDTVYLCTPYNKVIALDSETGTEKWAFDAKPFGGKEVNKDWNRCRGVGYYDAAAHNPAAGAKAQSSQCNQRIILSTLDARLFALDAHTGVPCEGFGENGFTDLKVGLGEIKPYFYMPTSAPTVIKNMILLGVWVYDGKSIDEPSGVVRAFSADTGELVWAWDIGNPNITKLPPPGETYTRSSPNVWAPISFDEQLGLVYLPTGNQTPDYWGGNRKEPTEMHSSSVVALSIETGREVWTFQTTHHDLWDYDVASQPALYDIPDGKGGTIPALAQLTKRGQIFLLDRRTGEPLADVVEKQVPKGGDPSDWNSATQPYSVGMPSVGAEPLTEASMWGASMFDQLYCRIQFRKLRYEGEFTPPSTVAALQYPGNLGGFNWGSASVDETTGIMYAAAIHMAQWFQLVPHPEGGGGIGGHTNTFQMEGAPYAIAKGAFMSPLGIPCNAPPYGTLTAIDLKARKIVWQRPIGTIEDSYLPGGFKGGLPIPLGMPPMAGQLSTASGLLFFAGTQDYYLRAFNSHTGEEIWRDRLPVGSNATPITYISQVSKRQFVVIAAGGARTSPERGDLVIAYALPSETGK